MTIASQRSSITLTSTYQSSALDSEINKARRELMKWMDENGIAVQLDEITFIESETCSWKDDNKGNPRKGYILNFKWGWGGTILQVHVHGGDFIIAAKENLEILRCKAIDEARSRFLTSAVSPQEPNLVKVEATLIPGNLGFKNDLQLKVDCTAQSQTHTSALPKVKYEEPQEARYIVIADIHNLNRREVIWLPKQYSDSLKPPLKRDVQIRSSL